MLVITGCQSFTTASQTRLRVIDLSVDAGLLDIHQDGHTFAYNLAYGTVTSYVALQPGTCLTAVTPAGLRQTLSSLKMVLLSGSQYTLLIDSPVSSLRQTLLVDQPPVSQSSVRFIHHADSIGAVDMYVVPAGHRLASTSPFLTNLVPGAATGYLRVPPGASTIVILPAGAQPSSSLSVLHIGRRIEYLQGSARTLILLNAVPALARTVDVLETDDSDAANDENPR